mmetsp:Transcript_9168/g.9238  ORF Transcript_9168/g.9238 Transcript_9168/m.9238 type:complete len:786 (+) Transcript_9168:135-2492(+)|eukprot:CAMPEP_0182430192 /NCGR_PEP_ID=MMETSP1167-20130531/38072_1 /TAXON_ID=2988 /ORGANISM="Mallomonas Sp, Strain CCMP3275" /LENGTH=785 /DNA_ID=CAMNT_0024615001 /DNA_START=51 /DNA_END=2408 /DNA_ORIENTATION=+
MSAVSVSQVLSSYLQDLDPDLLDYVTSVVDDMSIDERKNHNTLQEIIAPFLIDSGIVDEIGAEDLCKKIAVSFGGSGYKNALVITEEPETPILLSAPIRMIDHTLLQPIKSTYGGARLGDTSAEECNGLMDISALPTTQRQLRRMRRDNEQLQKILKAEAQAEEERRNILLKARMAAIKASRNAGRQSVTGVNIERFSLSHPSGTGELLTDQSLSLSPNRRYGMIGKNGAGKSTLLRSLATYQLSPLSLSHLRILLVDQHVEGDEESPLQWLLRADVERTSLLEEETRLSYYLHHTSENIPEDLIGVNLEVALSEVYERMDTINISTAENRARNILKGLGFTASMQDSPTNNLSGGWAMRSALGAALFVNPDLLLLDEPTNHLDLHALVWLENWLTNKFHGIAVLVSHDSFFLDTVCTDILELRSVLGGHSKGSLVHYSGDYKTYECTVEERKKNIARLKYTQDIQKEKLKEFISREGKKYDSPAHQAQRKMKMKQLEKMEEIEEIEEDSDVYLHLPKPNGVFDKNEKLIGLENVSFAWPDQDPLFIDVDFSINPGARLAILGKNGAGKTSLLNIIIGDTTPTSGECTRHPGCRIQMLQQHHYRGEQLDPNLSAFDHIKRLPQDETTTVGRLDPGSRQEETAIRSYLSDLGVQGPRAMLPVRYLSGGQRMRVALAVALFRKPDVLILDEPTNHLDGSTVNALCQALETYEGAIISVSHDEAFINKVIAGEDRVNEQTSTSQKNKSQNILGGELWIVSKCKVKRFDGSFRDYKKLIHRKVMAGEDL